MRSSGAVLIEGPKACGKTRTASRLAKSTYSLLADQNLQAIARTAPTVLFENPPSGWPILFDEWQTVPNLWNLVKEAVDRADPVKGQFLLTGSATPDDSIDLHPGTGRISVLRMRPMSLFETGHSTGTVSLKALFDGEDLPSAANLAMTVPDLLERIVVGGWPSLINAPVDDAQQWLDDYLQTIVLRDVPTMGTGRNPERVRRLLAALARGNGTAISVSSLVKDVSGAEGTVSRDAVNAYLSALDRLMLTEAMPAFNEHMRSTTRLRKSPTRFMVDPSLAVAALGQGPSHLLRDLNASGYHFENLVIRDLRVYSQPLRGQLSHWRDINNNEVDVIIELRDGRWAAIEVKLGPERVDGGAAALINFEKKIDTAKLGEPVFKAVVTATGASSMRPDGVMVIPLTTLGP